MKIEILKDYAIYHDGINRTYYTAGVHEVSGEYAARLIECGAAKVVSERALSPVVENKAMQPVKTNKGGKRNA